MGREEIAVTPSIINESPFIANKYNYRIYTFEDIKDHLVKLYFRIRFMP